MEDLKFVPGIEPWLIVAGALFFLACTGALAGSAWYLYARLSTGTLTWNRIPAMPVSGGPPFTWIFAVIITAWVVPGFAQGLYVCVLCLPWLLQVFYRIDVTQLWGTGRYSLTRLVGTAGWVYLTVISLLIPLSLALALLMKVVGIPALPQQVVQAMFKIKDPRIFFAMLAIAILVAPCAEEILFRGIILPLLKRYLSPLAALVLTSALFAVMHLPFGTIAHGETFNTLAGSLPMLVQLFCLAMVLGGLYEHTGCLPLSITLHTVFNFGTTMVLVLVKLVTL